MKSLLPVADQINDPGDGDNSAGPGRKILSKTDRLIQVVLGDGIGQIGVNSPGSGRTQRQSFDLRYIAANGSKRDLIQQLSGRLGPQR